MRLDDYVGGSKPFEHPVRVPYGSGVKRSVSRRNHKLTQTHHPESKTRLSFPLGALDGLAERFDAFTHGLAMPAHRRNSPVPPVTIPAFAGVENPMTFSPTARSLLLGGESTTIRGYLA